MRDDRKFLSTVDNEADSIAEIYIGSNYDVSL